MKTIFRKNSKKFISSNATGSICQNGFESDGNGLCAKAPPKTHSTVTVNPNNNPNALPTSVVPKPSSNPNSTPPGPKNPGNPNSKKLDLSPETRTLPKELEDYVEVDGDDYDEDFPTGEPPLDSGYENFLQFWITVVFVFVLVSF
ncbi:hypothetical protein B9Z55_021483 [Caenorhabditis nigoni]|uniref:Uncharacterized protein n=1 Tax=Caenorhabditis nigoni TaxID=1611254 RepID=A0A2G5TS44_9PELO|nr:hypothetical protein B9Z55_021483 [Caenorhabditis nigoni]